MTELVYLAFAIVVGIVIFGFVIYLVVSAAIKDSRPPTHPRKETASEG